MGEPSGLISIPATAVFDLVNRARSCPYRRGGVGHRQSPLTKIAVFDQPVPEYHVRCHRGFHSDDIVVFENVYPSCGRPTVGRSAAVEAKTRLA